MNAKLLFTNITEEFIIDFEKYSKYFVTEKSHHQTVCLALSHLLWKKINIFLGHFYFLGF